MQGVIFKYRCSVDKNDASLTEIEIGFMQRILVIVVLIKIVFPQIEDWLMKIMFAEVKCGLMTVLRQVPLKNIHECWCMPLEEEAPKIESP